MYHVLLYVIYFEFLAVLQKNFNSMIHTYVYNSLGVTEILDFYIYLEFF